jgi:hypothetical protein
MGKELENKARKADIANALYQVNDACLAAFFMERPGDLERILRVAKITASRPPAESVGTEEVAEYLASRFLRHAASYARSAGISEKNFSEMASEAWGEHEQR